MKPLTNTCRFNSAFFRGLIPVESLAISFFFLLGPVGLLLIRLRIFHPLTHGLLTLLLTGCVVPWFRNGRARAETIGTRAPSGLIVFLIALLLSFFNAWFPAYYVLGGRDPGLYLAFSSLAANTGGMDLGVFPVEQINATLGDMVSFAYPGIYDGVRHGLADAPGKLIPQFHHMFCAYGALAHSLFGIEGVVRTSAVIGFFALIAMGRLLRRLVTGWMVPVGVLLLGINAAFLWGARQSLTEILQVFLLLSGVCFIIEGCDEGRVPKGLFGGVILGTAVANHPSALLNGIAFIGFALGYFDKMGRVQRPLLAAGAACAVASALGIVDGLTWARPYVVSRLHIMYPMWALCGGSIAFLFAASVLARRAKTRRGPAGERVFTRLIQWCVILLGCWLTVRYIGGFKESLPFSRRAVRELSWYLHPFSYILILAGMFLSARSHRRAAFLPLLVLAGFTFFVFTLIPRISPYDHYWASRRWIAFVIPLGVIFMTLALQCACNRLRSLNRAAPGALLALWLVLYGANAYRVSAPFLLKPVLKEYDEGLKRVVSHLDEHAGKKSFLLSNDHVIATMLSYVYGHPTIVLSPRGTQELASSSPAGRLEGYTFVGHPFPERGYHLDNVQRFLLWRDYPEECRSRLPDRIFRMARLYDIGDLVRSEEPAPGRTFRLLDGRFFWPAAQFDPDREVVVSSENSGVLLHGPYVCLGPGSYRVTWRGSVHGDTALQRAFADVFTAGTVIKQTRLPSPDTQPGVLASIDFALADITRGVEFRVYAQEPVSLEISAVQLRRLESHVASPAVLH
jgi:hypothetical protein